MSDDAVKFLNAWGYQGDAMALPVANVEESAAYYSEKMGFAIASREDSPASITLQRPDVQFAIVESGGDPSQDGCAFEVTDTDAVLQEFRANGLNSLSGTKTETNENGVWKVFYVVAPDGLCFWIGERLSSDN